MYNHRTLLLFSFLFLSHGKLLFDNDFRAAALFYFSSITSSPTTYPFETDFFKKSSAFIILFFFLNQIDVDF